MKPKTATRNGRNGSKSAAKGSGLTLGIDLGGTKILAGVVDGTGRILGRGKLKTPFQSDEASLAAALIAAADAALSEAGRSRDDVTALAVAAPGPIDAANGVLLRANNLAVKEFSVHAVLSPAFPNAGTIRLENDVRLAALAEARLGAGRGAASLVAIWVGTGVGGAVLFDGKLWTGRNKNAGEIGQTQLDFRLARPGKLDGTFEGIAAKVGITRYLRKKIDAGGKTVLKKVILKEESRLRGSQLQDALQLGDKLTVKAVARSAKAVGMVMGNIFNILSPELFILGGGVGVDLGEPYLLEVRRWAEAFAFTTELGSIRIETAALGDDAGILGAALYAREPR
ncbi:MAG: ROK family protein [Thermoanaerobaculia bacterium]